MTTTQNIMTREDIITAIKEGKTVKSSTSLPRFKFALQGNNLVIEVGGGKGVSYTHASDDKVSSAYIAD